MWRSRNNRDGTTVVCIACGTSLPRSEAREYDKEGDRWERHGKSFEYLCKECYRGLCHQPRDELESLLVDVERAVDAEPTGSTDATAASDPPRSVDPDPDTGADADVDADADADADGDAASEDGRRAGRPADRTFLAEYFRAVEDRYGPAEEPGHES